MNRFDHTIPVSQAKLDAHASCAKKIELANYAMLEAIKETLLFDDPLAENLFGVSKETLKLISEAPKSQLVALSQIGLPLMACRLADPFCRAILQNKDKTDILLIALLKTFSSPVPLTSLG